MSKEFKLNNDTTSIFGNIRQILEEHESLDETKLTNKPNETEEREWLH